MGFRAGRSPVTSSYLHQPALRARVLAEGSVRRFRSDPLPVGEAGLPPRLAGSNRGFESPQLHKAMGSSSARRTAPGCRPGSEDREYQKASELVRGHGSTLVVLKLDHVVIAVSDLAVAAREIEARHGLTAIEGGRHPGWGTANRIVPLGDAYLELVAVVDEAEAAQSPFGRWVAGADPGLFRPLGWAVRTHQLDDAARRLGLTVHAGSRAGRDDRLLRWRLAGIEQAAADSSLPFFIEWAPGSPLPGRVPVTHRAGAVRIAQLQLVGDADRLTAWLGDHRLPIAVGAGAPELTTVVLTGAAGQIARDAGQP